MITTKKDNLDYPSKAKELLDSQRGIDQIKNILESKDERKPLSITFRYDTQEDSFVTKKKANRTLFPVEISTNRPGELRTEWLLYRTDHSDDSSLMKLVLETFSAGLDKAISRYYKRSLQGQTTTRDVEAGDALFSDISNQDLIDYVLKQTTVSEVAAREIQKRDLIDATFDQYWAGSYSAPNFVYQFYKKDVIWSLLDKGIEQLTPANSARFLDSVTWASYHTNTTGMADRLLNTPEIINRILEKDSNFSTNITSQFSNSEALPNFFFNMMMAGSNLLELDHIPGFIPNSIKKDSLEWVIDPNSVNKFIYTAAPFDGRSMDHLIDYSKSFQMDQETFDKLEEFLSFHEKFQPDNHDEYTITESRLEYIKKILKKSLVI